MRAIPPQAWQQFGVFTAIQAYQAGWSSTELRRAVAAGGLTRLRRRSYAAVLRGQPHDVSRLLLLRHAAATALQVPAATISHSAALIAHGLPALSVGEVPCVTLPALRRTLQVGLHLHRQVLPPEQLDRRFGLSVTSAARTCLDVAREHGVDGGIVAIDAALRGGLASRAEFTAVYESIRGTPGSTAARAVLELADPRSESPLESLSRIALLRCSSAPDLQVAIRDSTGAFIGRVDFYWPELGVVGEADGRLKYHNDGAAGSQSLWDEKRRQDRLEAAGLVVIRWGWREANDPPRLLALVEAAFAKARLLRSAGIYPDVSYDR